MAPLHDALGIGEQLVIVLNSIIQDLPEDELLEIRSTLERSIGLVDDVLYQVSLSNFEMLTVSDVSTTTAYTDSIASTRSHFPTEREARAAYTTTAPPPSPASSVSRKKPSTRTSTTTRANTTGLAAVVREAAVDPPVSTRREVITTPLTRVAPRVTATAPRDRSLTYGASAQRRINIDDPLRPVIVSTRPNVGYPQYRFHPEFTRPGIPGIYTQPPADPSGPNQNFCYVITKGLYVGIFSSWNECSPWVLKVTGSIYSKANSWNEAMVLYNGRLYADACEVLP